jgi:O-antigen ligase
MGGKVERYFIPAVIGFAPFILFLLTWAPNGRSHLQGLVQVFYLPIIGAEIFTIAVALREGMITAMQRLSWHRLPTAALLTLLAIAIVTAITAPNPEAARLWTFFWLLHLAFGFSVAHLCTKSIRPRDLVAIYLVGFVAFVGAAALFETQVTDPAFDWIHSWPAVTHIRHFGYYASASTGLAIGLAATERRPRMLALLFIFCTTGFAFALWTGSRGAVIGVAGAMVAGFAFFPAMRRIIVWGGAALSLAIAALIASLAPAHGILMGVGRTVTQTVDSGDISTGRTRLWLNAIGAIEKRPVFGYGEDQMSTVAPFGTLGQTHEVILQILLAWGVVGLVCVGVLTVWFFMRSLPMIRHNQAELLAPIMATFALATMALFDGALFHVMPVSIFAACAGMIASRWSRPEQAPQTIRA